MPTPTHARVAHSFSLPTPESEHAFAVSCVRDLPRVIAESRREVRRLVTRHGETEIALLYGAGGVVFFEIDRGMPFVLRAARGRVRERLAAWLRSRGWTSVTSRTPLEQLVGFAALELGDVIAPVVSLAEARARRTA